MNTMFKSIGVFFVTFCIFTLSSASAEGMKFDVSIGGTSNKSGTSTVTGSTLFSGSSQTDGAPEITASMKFLESVPNMFAYGRLSGKSHKHTASFMGANIGSKNCDSFIGGGLGWDFTPNSPIDVRISGGFEHYDCNGKYALGGVSFNQTDMNNTVGSAELQVSGDLGLVSDGLKGVHLGVFARHSGKMESSVNPFAGINIKNETGGTTDVGLVVRIPIGAKH